MHGKRSRFSGARLDVEYTSKAISGWGGLVSMTRFWEHLGLRKMLAAALPDGRTSPNQIGVVDQVIQLMLTVLIGGTRFQHVDRVRMDEALRQMVGAVRFGSDRSLTRYLSNFRRSQNEQTHWTLNGLILNLLKQSGTSGDVLDLDSTVFTRHGEQEGSAKAYNPQRRGARSHHPLLAMFATSKVIAHAWLRAGSASTHRGCREFLLELLAQLPEGFRIHGVRADSGFFSHDFMSLLEEKGLPYAIRMKMSKGLIRWSAGLKDWTRVSPDDADIEITEALYSSPKHKGQRRRVVVIREAKRRVSEGVLFEIVDYDYRAIVTTMTEAPSEVWRFYNKRGDCENRIKELKYDFNADEFCLNSFNGTEVAFRLICFTFNLVSLFKATVLRDTRTTLGTIRTKLFVIGVSVGTSGRRTVLRLGLKGRWKTEFQKLLQTIRDWGDSTAPQLAEAMALCAFEPPSVWSLRKTPGLFLLPN